MKKSNIIIGSLVGILALAGCNKVMDKTDLKTVPGDLIFNDSAIAKLNLDNIYENNLPTWGGGTGIGDLNGLNGNLSDESYGESKYFEGTITNTDVKDYGTALDKGNNYGKIRTINMFLRDMNASPLEQYTINTYNAQALFFRAWRYFDLVRIYGGVPLVLTPLEAVGNEAKMDALLPRNTTAECIKQIVSDLDTAIKYLPGKYTATSDWGRITSGAAAAFKGRVLLTYASPQFNPNDLQERWQAAYDANLQAKTLLDANGFGLFASYNDMWFTEVNNPEAVMVTGYNTATGDQTKKNNSYDNSTRPSYLGTGGGSNQPSWELVKAYPMKDGKAPGASATYTYSDQLFYKNRDPRFNSTIGYNGSTWSINGITTYRLWTYFYKNSNNATVTSENKASNTGFYLKKAITTSGTASTAQYAGTDWMEIRYAEVLLNLAESAVGINKLGTSDEGYAGLVAIRKRAGIEAGDGFYGLTSGLDRAGLFSAILYERQIEQAFEGKRFWDLRRWKLIESTLNGKRRNKMVITLKTGAGIPTFTELADPNSANYRDKLNLDDMYTNYFTLAPASLDTKYAINWQSTYYFFPIPQDAINNNPNLVQNNNWGGNFNPLQ
ncbi:Starch-binding associating with outer membrane [Filimonas lacunae]|uniref:Starch-binding associating with outer membrane n=1 Tax=Filimonas lacunae TaxID=477680 RepID=A0A173MCA9_9BACT|nr:RagB/SusD family nutrient uptake outer membrane protein [Filimonas lacunae]BAV05166.1 outer membrane protein, nutrient binding [Filimonas lacunae]SIT22835.1 Starch-binding associating with outer membrane [Filimonas lacunae]